LSPVSFRDERDRDGEGDERDLPKPHASFLRQAGQTDMRLSGEKNEPRMCATTLRGPHSTLRMRILVSAPARTVAGEEEVCRVSLERERERDSERGEEIQERESKRQHLRAAAVASSGAHGCLGHLGERERLDVPTRAIDAWEGGVSQKDKQMKRRVYMGTSGIDSIALSLHQELVVGYQLVIPHSI